MVAVVGFACAEPAKGTVDLRVTSRLTYAQAVDSGIEPTIHPNPIH
jgi:hypothetical protein